MGLLIFDFHSAANFLKKEKLAENECSDSDFTISEGVFSLQKLPIYFCDNSNLDVVDIDFMLDVKTNILDRDTEFPRVLFIDDLSSLKSHEPADSKNHLTAICIELKALAKKYGVAIVLAHTITDNIDMSGKRPALNLLRHHAEIEQHCDMAILLYRPEYFKIEMTEDGMPTHGVLEAIVAKNKSGKTGTIKMEFIGKYSRVEEVSESINPFDGMIRISEERQ